MADRDQLLNDIRGGVRLRPAVTIDKSKPVICAEGEKPMKLEIAAPRPPPSTVLLPPAPPSAPPPPPLPVPKAPKLPPSFASKMAKKPDRDALMNEIRGGRNLRHVETVDKSKPIFTDSDLCEAKVAPPANRPTQNGLMGELSAKLASRSVSTCSSESRDPPSSGNNIYAEPRKAPERIIKVESTPVFTSSSAVSPPPPPPVLPQFGGYLPRCDSVPSPMSILVASKDTAYNQSYSKKDSHFTDAKPPRQFPSPRSATDVESASESGFASYEFEESSLSPQSESPPSASPERLGVSVPDLQKQLRSRSVLPQIASEAKPYPEDVKEIARSVVSDTLRKFEKGQRRGSGQSEKRLEPTSPREPVRQAAAAYVENGHYAKKSSPTTPKWGKAAPEPRPERFDALKRSGSVSDIFRRAQETPASPEPAFRMPRRQGSIHDIVKKLEAQNDQNSRETAPAPIKLHTTCGEVRKSVETYGHATRRTSSGSERPEYYDAWLRGTSGRVEERSKQFESMPTAKRSSSHRPQRSEEKVGRILRSNNPGETIRTWRAPPTNRDVLSRPGVDKVTEHIEAKAVALKSTDASTVLTDDGRMMYGVDFLSNMNPTDLPKLYRMVICDDVDGPTISLRRKTGLVE